MARLPWWNRDLAWLFAGRIIRSVSMAYLVIIVPLYLAHIGFGPARVGEILGLTAIGGTMVGVAAGSLADRYGRKPVLVVLALFTSLGAAAFLLTHNFVLLALGASLGTIGRGGGVGSGGAFGPFFAAEQALVTEQTVHVHRNAVFSSLAFAGTLAGAAGSLIAGWPEVAGRFGLTGFWAGYRPLFLLTLLTGLLLAATVLPVTERPGRTPPTVGSLSWHLVGRFALVNAVNGLGIGFLGPFLSYWFYHRYGVGPGHIGLLYTAINLLSTLPYLGAARLSRRFGSVRTVVWARTVSVLLLALLPLMPGFLPAGVILAGRTLFNTLSLPLRQSYVMGVSREEERSTVAALSNLPSQVTASLGPPVGGHLLEAGLIDLPIWLAAFFQMVNAVLYGRFFGRIRPPEEQIPEDPAVDPPDPR